MPLSMNHSPIEAPANGARYCMDAVSDAVATTTMVYCIAPVSSSTAMLRATFDCFWPMAT